MNWDRLNDRYMRDPVPIRLGNLASSLAALSTSAASAVRHDHARTVIDECKHFIEWTGPETDIEVAAELVRLQVRLAGWQRHWEELRADPDRVAEVSAEARRASDPVLEWSGLLDG